MLELRNISFVYPDGSFQLHDLSFTLQAGEPVLLYGRNGSGKTTLARILLGLEKPVSGAYLLDGENALSFGLQEMGCRIGFVRQEADKQLAGETVLGEMLFPARSDSVREQRADALLKRFDLQSYRDCSPLLLSFGEKRRLAVAAVLLRQPGILVLDEPTTGLDGRRKRELLEYVSFLRQETGLTLLLISHDLDTVLPYVSRMIYLQAGQIGFDGTPQQALGVLPERELAPYLQLLKRLRHRLPEGSLPTPEALARLLRTGKRKTQEEEGK